MRGEGVGGGGGGGRNWREGGGGKGRGGGRRGGGEGGKGGGGEGGRGRGHFHILPPGNAMLLSYDHTVVVGSGGLCVPRTFLRKCFSPPITSSTQVTVDVVIRTQDVSKLPPDAGFITESAAAEANNQYLQLPSFVCKHMFLSLLPQPALAGSLTIWMPSSPAEFTS